MEKKVRMTDIAQKLGISVVSVSRALAGKDGVSEETRARIFAVAREMGYQAQRPQKENPARFETIGIAVADRFIADSSFYYSLYRQVLMCAHRAGFSALLEIIPPAAEREGALPAMIQSKKINGLIVMGNMEPAYLDVLSKTGLPYVLLDFYEETLDADSVISDNVAGAYRLTNHLLQSGRKEVGFVGSVFASSSIMDRYLGYTKALLQAGIVPRREWLLEDRGPDGKYISLVLPEKLPQAFVCNCDEVAFNLIYKLKERGCRIPTDVAVTGYDDHRFSLLCTPQLTTYRVNIEEMGRVAVSRLVKKIYGENTTGSSVVVGGTLIKRDSA